jgi:hypothetical protein
MARHRKTLIRFSSDAEMRVQRDAADRLADNLFSRLFGVHEFRGSTANRISGRSTRRELRPAQMRLLGIFARSEHLQQSPSRSAPEKSIRPRHSKIRMRGRNYMLKPATLTRISHRLFVLLLLLQSALSGQTSLTVAVPEHVLYLRLFHRIEHLKHLSEEGSVQGQDLSHLRLLISQKAGLTENEATTLERIALECNAAVANQDARAKEVIRRARLANLSASIMNGPPNELLQMQIDRNAIILAARDRLRAALQDESFSKLDVFVHNELKPQDVKSIGDNGKGDVQ